MPVYIYKITTSKPHDDKSHGRLPQQSAHPRRYFILQEFYEDIYEYLYFIIMRAGDIRHVVRLFSRSCLVSISLFIFFIFFNFFFCRYRKYAHTHRGQVQGLTFGVTFFDHEPKTDTRRTRIGGMDRYYLYIFIYIIYTRGKRFQKKKNPQVYNERNCLSSVLSFFFFPLVTILEPDNPYTEALIKFYVRLDDNNSTTRWSLVVPSIIMQR